MAAPSIYTRCYYTPCYYTPCMPGGSSGVSPGNLLLTTCSCGRARRGWCVLQNCCRVTCPPQPAISPTLVNYLLLFISASSAVCSPITINVKITVAPPLFRQSLSRPGLGCVVLMSTTKTQPNLAGVSCEPRASLGERRGVLQPCRRLGPIPQDKVHSEGNNNSSSSLKKAHLYKIFAKFSFLYHISQRQRSLHFNIPSTRFARFHDAFFAEMFVPEVKQRKVERSTTGVKQEHI